MEPFGGEKYEKGEPKEIEANTDETANEQHAKAHTEEPDIKEAYDRLLGSE